MPPAALLAAAAPGAAPAAGRPHLLFMMADQLRHDAMGAVWPGARTPALDALAAGGARFAAAYSSTPTCTPARAALLTGQKPWNHGMLGYGNVAPRYPYEMPRALAEAGYETVEIGKDHFGWDDDAPGANPFAPGDAGAGVSHGYNRTAIYDGLTHENDNYYQWFARESPGTPGAGWRGLTMNSWKGKAYQLNESLHPTAWVGRLACEFLGSYASERPFMLKVSFHRPHSPYDPPQRVLDGVAASDLPPIAVAADGWDRRWNGSLPGCDWHDVQATCGDMPEPDRTLGRRAYYGSVRFVDEWVGRIMATLTSRGLVERTVVLWTSDHGDGQADHYHWKKGTPYEAAAHVPLLLRWPESIAGRVRVRRGAVLPHVAELRDVFPTLLDAAGGSPPEGRALDGKSLFCALGGDAALRACGGWREWLDLEHSTCYNVTNHWNALTDGRVKYIFNAYYETEAEREQLFNLTADPRELVDLARLLPRETAKWRARMVAQFEAEGRGDAWVRNGTLQRRVKGIKYNHNFPGHGPGPSPRPSGGCRAAPAEGEPVTLAPNAANASVCQELAVAGAGGAFSSLRLAVAPSLCVARAAAGLELRACVPGDAAQYWRMNSTGGRAVAVDNPPTGLCIAAAGAAVGVAPCAASASQAWTFGTSGRLCTHGGASGRCLSAAAPPPATPA